MTITIKDVAKKAGTSTATVSKVMNSSYSISQPTIDRVKAAMEELHYRPNLQARNFARKSTQAVIFATQLGQNIGFTNPHMFEMMSGLEQALTNKGYTLIVKNITAEGIHEYIQNAVETKMADGLVIHASVISKELDELIYKNAIPHIVIGKPDFYNHFCWIDVNNSFAGELAARHLLEKGYQSLAYIGGTEEDKISMHRLEGIFSVLQERDVIVPRDYVQRGESLCDSGYFMTEALLKTHHKPDAIICANNNIAYGCVHALHDNNMNIPKDMAVLTFDDYPFSKILKPMLTVVNIDVYDMGVQEG